MDGHRSWKLKGLMFDGLDPSVCRSILSGKIVSLKTCRTDVICSSVRLSTHLYSYLCVHDYYGALRCWSWFFVEYFLFLQQEAALLRFYHQSSRNGNSRIRSCFSLERRRAMLVDWLNQSSNTFHGTFYFTNGLILPFIFTTDSCVRCEFLLWLLR